MAIVTKADLARELEVTPPRVSQYIKAGMPVRSDGKIDRDDALKWLKENRTGLNTREPGLNTRGPGRDKPDKGTDRAARLAGKPASKQPDAAADPFDELAEDPALALDDENLTTAEAVRRKENYLGLQRRLEFLKARNDLVSRRVAEHEFHAQGMAERDAWRAWPARVAIPMADEITVDPSTGKVDYRILASILAKFVREHQFEMGEPSEFDCKPAH